MSDGQTIGLSSVIQMIGCNQLPCTGDVLNDGIGISRDVFPNMACEHTAVGVKSSPRSGADDYHNRLSFVELLSRCRRSNKHESQSDYDIKQAQNCDRHSNSSKILHRKRNEYLFWTYLPSCACSNAPAWRVVLGPCSPLAPAQPGQP